MYLRNLNVLHIFTGLRMLCVINAISVAFIQDTKLITY